LYGFETKAEDFLLFLDYLNRQNRLNNSKDKLILICWIKLLNQKIIEGGFSSVN
jgi:hypothetical protein